MGNELVCVTAQTFRTGETVQVQWFDEYKYGIFVVKGKAFEDIGLALEHANTDIIKTPSGREQATLNADVMAMNLDAFADGSGDYAGVLPSELSAISRWDVFKDSAPGLAKIVDSLSTRLVACEPCYFTAVYETGYEATTDWESGATEYDPWYNLLGRLDMNKLQIVND